MSTNYEMWLLANGSKEKLRLPVHPEKIEIQRGSNNETVKLSGAGEVTIMQKAPASRVSFSCFFPSSYFNGCQVKKPLSPKKYVKKINKMKNSGKPVKFVSTACNISGYFSIESFSYYEEGGDVGTIQYSLVLKEYKSVKSKKIKIQISKATYSSNESRVDNTQQAKTYTVVAGDCLWIIAQKTLGDASRWPEIYNLNTSVIGGNPNIIYPGQVFTLPT